MNNFIKKLSYLILSFSLLLGSCDVEDSLTITSPAPEFVLNTPGISTVFLNFALPDNPAFTINWKDQLSSGPDYTIEMATDSDFTSPIVLGNTINSNFSMTVKDFNDAINNAGITNFRDIAVYMRIKTSSRLSNNILMLVTTYPVNPPTITGVDDGDAFVLALANNDGIAITIGWEDAILNSSLNLDIEYILEAALPNTAFTAPIELAKVQNTNTISLTNAQLNRAAIEAGIPIDATGDLAIRLRAVIKDGNSGEILERISSTTTIKVTTYLTVLDLSTNWGVVGSAANNWGATPDLPFFKTEVDGVLVAYVNLLDGEFKFRENNDWANNYGSDSSTGGALVAGGGNMTATAGSYKIVMDLNNLTYTIESFSLGIVGGAYNNWGATPDFMLEYDQYSDVFRGIVTLIDGEMKFRMNNDWGTNWGDDGANGSLELNGANIQVTAGIYIATVNMKDLSYSLEKIEHVWGLVGGAYNDWGATPDAQFTRDWSKPFNDVWILNDVTLIDGEYKFRSNNDWGTNYGDDGANGTLELNGANIIATAGTYSFSIDFSDLNNITYTIK